MGNIITPNKYYKASLEADWAVGGFIGYNMEIMQASAQAAVDVEAPVMIQASCRVVRYDPAVIGDSRVKGIAYHITKEAESPEGLHEGRRTPRKARAVTVEEIASSAPSHSLRRLQAEVSYLRQEVDFLKKIMQTENGTKRGK